MLYILFTLLGLLIGSFLNVVIHRWPRNESIVYPSSHCIHCNHQIKWYENIPLFSYIFLKGRCSQCNKKISLRYPLVELITGVLFLLVFSINGLNYALIINLILTIIFIIIVFIDIDHHIIPDSMTISIFVLAIINIFMDSSYDYLSHIYGLLFGFMILFVIRFLSTKVYKKEAMGFGDVKLLGALGLLLGLSKTILTFILSFVIAAIIEVILLKIRKNPNNEIAFGPYLIIGAFIAYYFGSTIISAYLALLGF